MKPLIAHGTESTLSRAAVFAVCDQEGVHPVNDMVIKTYRHLNFF